MPDTRVFVISCFITLFNTCFSFLHPRIRYKTHFICLSRVLYSYNIHFRLSSVLVFDPHYAYTVRLRLIKICSSLNKITRTPFKSVEQKTKILELIHSDLCDFHSTPSLGNKKYVITFIDDFSKFCYVYLLHTKDRLLNFLSFTKMK